MDSGGFVAYDVLAMSNLYGDILDAMHAAPSWV